MYSFFFMVLVSTIPTSIYFYAELLSYSSLKTKNNLLTCIYIPIVIIEIYSTLVVYILYILLYMHACIHTLLESLPTLLTYLAYSKQASKQRVRQAGLVDEKKKKVIQTVFQG